MARRSRLLRLPLVVALRLRMRSNCCVDETMTTSRKIEEQRDNGKTGGPPGRLAPALSTLAALVSPSGPNFPALRGLCGPGRSRLDAPNAAHREPLSAGAPGP